MMRSLLVISLLLTQLSLFAQKEIISTVSSLIKQSKHEEANLFLDSLIKGNANCADALMMKGNMILNRAWQNAPTLSLEASHDESIFNSDIGSMGESPRYVDLKTAREVEALWKKCISIDSSRVDIHQGLCTLYGMAIMKNEMLLELPALLKAASDKSEDFAYQLEDYASAFNERGRFDDCMEVYKFIAKNFPESGGLLSDMAVIYFKNARTKEAVECARQALTKPTVDFLSVYSCTTIICCAEGLDKGAELFENGKWNRQEPEHWYYTGIIRFYKDDMRWREPLQRFLSGYKKNDHEQDDPRPVIAKLMTSPDFKFDINSYHQLMKSVPYELEILLLAKKLMITDEEKCEPALRVARILADKNCFEKAITVLQEVAKLKRTPEQDSTYILNLAYCQYKTGNKAASVSGWKQLLNSSDFFVKSAACYFLGCCYQQQDKKEEAKELFARVSEHSADSKFANFCRWKLGELK